MATGIDREGVGEKKSDPLAVVVFAWVDCQDTGCQRGAESAATDALPASRGRGCPEGIDPCSLFSLSLARGGFGRAQKNPAGVLLTPSPISGATTHQRDKIKDKSK